ncbi:glycosyltransferase family 4 protein [Marinobacter sp. F4216]|uniref:glycosyltransferase family 4 protein n=1 Tax=Marinobacter sp. F4216 TaxID=2874281 RepID=UPI001CBDE3D4|nr:glycosyltransferase family 4 protein [Marinobacter sp. F4216]MBZ2167861.1 glycosyltransferase family 4 protein [Marinobacter sp. F4216]
MTQIVSGDLWAGAEVQVFNLCKALLATNTVEVTAVVLNEGVLCKKLRNLGIHVDLADETNLSALQMISAIRKHCEQHNTRVLHTHGFKENVLGIAAKKLARVPRSIRTVHGNPENQITPAQPLKWLVQNIDHLLGRTMQQAVIAVSSQLEETLTPMFPGKVHKIFNFIDIDTIREQGAVEHTSAHQEPKVGLVGRLVPVKRVDIFLQMIRQLNQRGIRCKGIVIGSGPLEPELKKMASNLGITNHIEFRGFVEPVYRALKDLDVLVMPSDHEGLPMVLLEALALEIPIVAHRVGGIPEVLADGHCGWLVEDHSPRGYAAAVTEVLNNESERTTKLDAGLARAHRLFGAEANVKLYEELYGT